MPVIRYNGYTIPNIYNKFSYNENEKEIHLTCTFLVLEDSGSALVSECKRAEEKLTEINKPLSLSFSGTTEMTYSHESNTGFLSRPTLIKLTNEMCTETSRAYEFSCVIGLPFMQETYGCRRDADMSVSFETNRQRHVRFNVLYTAEANGLAAKEKYEEQARLWTASMLEYLGGSYTLLKENFNIEQENKILKGFLEYIEILENKSVHSDYNISYSESRQRIVSFQVQYLFDGILEINARQNYITNAKSWCASVLSKLTGIFEIVSEKFTVDIRDKTLNGNIVYKEILSSQISSSDIVNVPGIVNLITNYSTHVDQQVASPIFFTKNIIPNILLLLNFSASFDKEVVLKDTDIDSYYRTQIRPRLISHAFQMTGIGIDYARINSYIIQKEIKSVNPHNFTMSGNLSILVLKANDVNYLEATEALHVFIDEGVKFDKLWNQKDYSHNIWHIGKTKKLNRFISISQLGGGFPIIPFRLTNQIVPGDRDVENAEENNTNPYVPGKWILLYSTSKFDRQLLGSETSVNSEVQNKVFLHNLSVSEGYVFVSDIDLTGDNIGIVTV